ncbi:MAG: hypothetical protein V1921_06795 [Candidatus Altiarchaeota archaeon]
MPLGFKLRRKADEKPEIVAQPQVPGELPVPKAQTYLMEGSSVTIPESLAKAARPSPDKLDAHAVEVEDTIRGILGSAEKLKSPGIEVPKVVALLSRMSRGLEHAQDV